MIRSNLVCIASENTQVEISAHSTEIFSMLSITSRRKGHIKEMDDPLLIYVNKNNDERGYFQKILDPVNLRNSGVRTFKAVEMLTTSTIKHGVRGMHIQMPPYQSRKIVWVTSGEILDVLVDLRSKRVFTFELRDETEFALYVPANFAHGFQVLSDAAIVNYLIDSQYNQEFDTGFNPLTFGFQWPKPVSVMSARDKNLKHFEDFCGEK